VTGRSRMLQLRSRDGFCLDQLTWKMAATIDSTAPRDPRDPGNAGCSTAVRRGDGGLSAERINVLRRERG
jgi:hypothetical protein